MTPSTDQGETQGRGNRTFVAPGPWILTLGWAGGLVRKPSYRGESSVYSAGGKLSALEENAVTGDHNLVERKARLGAIPLYEFINRVSVSTLRVL